MNLEKFEEGEKVLFNERKKPLTVKESNPKKLLVKGPNGGEYKIYLDGETLLFCKPGNEKYSSYCENLREIGEWQRKDEYWVHSKSEAKINLVQKDNGFWTLKSAKFEDELDTPMYGYSKKEYAVQDAEKFVDNNPEG